ncbi:DUF6018 family natural product bioysynthesis protein [Bacillus altitudinis]|uniref:DUF6018 family natural product bioysynthesis protein n=1 Tax=Bacillus altitudinis TaxID=293387 RepID=UPI001C242DBD|nr:DUF6018 family natural product bioysynthesis protein [Bacillus altitudinis]MBU8855195.1 hypothetical protein [Bacillus sp. FJAT-26377]MCY7454254.1 DUF6018 family natural product bioysynthesis protein [Bacillus altitudinis]
MKTAELKLSELFGTEFNSIRPKKRGKRVEIIFRNGERFYFNSQFRKREAVVKEVLPYITFLKEKHRDSLVWRIQGEMTYNFGTEVDTQSSFGRAMLMIKKKTLNTVDKTLEYFGLIEEEQR